MKDPRDEWPVSAHARSASREELLRVLSSMYGYIAFLEALVVSKVDMQVPLDWKEPWRRALARAQIWGDSETTYEPAEPLPPVKDDGL